MFYLVGGIVAGLEIIAIGALLKVGYHVGDKFLKNCGEKEVKKYPKIRVRGGRKRVLEQTTGNELSIFPG